MSYSHIKSKNSVTNYVYMLWAKWQNKVFFNSTKFESDHKSATTVCTVLTSPSLSY